MVRVECDIAPVQNATRRAATQQKQSRVRKVATPARTGEKGRALAAARLSTRLTQNLQLLHRPLCQTYSCQKWPTTLRTMPRLSEPGPFGMRAEHW